MRKILAGAWAIGLFGMAGVALAQTAPPSGATEAQMNAAFKDLSAVYGAPVVRADQAKAICNDEKYVVECAEIGKKHDLFSDDRVKQVDTLLTEFKGEAVEKMKQCEDTACLVDVATSIAKRLSSGNSKVAQAVDLTPQKVNEKKTIVETAKSLGVDFEACRTMDPDTASIELLRGCARLAKHENVQKYIPQETKDRAAGADASIALKESLASGQVSCGDNTLEGCGNFCLAPPAEARSEGVSAIPEVCRQIATRFFGSDGIKELEKAYSSVQTTFNTFSDRAQNIVFTTMDGKTLSDPGSIGRYMEEAGGRGDVEAVTRGMEFLVKKGFVTAQDKEFAISMVKKVKERGSVDFGECRTDPSLCDDLISEEERGQFGAMREIEKVMKSEMSKRGVADPFQCSSDPSIGQSCLEAARAAIPQIELLAKDSPHAQNIVSDIRQKIRFGEAGMEARSRVEQRFKTEGDFSIGDNNFRSISDLESFCKTNPQQCLNETAREGIFSKDVAAEKYERAIETSYRMTPPQDGRDAFRPADAQFNKEEALQQFKSWLDNPQGPPPQPPGFGQPQYQQYPPYSYPADQRYQNQPQYPYQQQYGQYQQYPRQPVCPSYAASMPIPCKSGEYRQESVNELGCRVLGACIPFDTRTEPPRPDGKNICPALPTVESCPAGEAKEVSFSSPECGTYYSCRPSNVVQPPPIQTTSCERYGSGWRTVDSSGNCFSPSMAEYRTVNGTLYACSAVPAYGCSASDIPPTPTPYPVPSGQREQVWNSQGLRSWVRADAEQSRIESLKQACANVGSQANIWMSGAGTQSSTDFGMPDPAKCANVTSTTQTNTTSGSCSSELIGLLGNGCHSMGSGWFDSEMTRYVTSYNSQTVRSCTTEPVSGCSGGNYTQPTSCSSGQYWNGSACVTTSTSDTSYSTESAQQGCATAGGTWDSASNYCRMPTTQTTTCASGQYWNGSSCVTSTTQTTQPSTSCGSGQYWNGSACVTTSTSDTTTSGTYTPPPTDSGTYTPPPTDSSSYTPPPTDSGTYTPPPTESSPPPSEPAPAPAPSEPIAFIFCPEGHDWNGAYCTLSPRSPFERYTASAWSAVRSLFGF